MIYICLQHLSDAITEVFWSLYQKHIFMLLQIGYGLKKTKQKKHCMILGEELYLQSLKTEIWLLDC